MLGASAPAAPSSPRHAIAITACAVIAASELLPWVVSGFGTAGTSYSGLDVWPLAVAELLAVGVTAGLAGAALWLRRPQLTEAAVVAACVAVAFTASVTIALETAAMAIPDSALPATLRRNGLDLGAGLGLWIAAAAGLVAILALADWSVRSLEVRSWANRANRQWILALAALLSLTVLFGWLRYQTWFDASAAGEHLGLAGWASPWIGPLSLIAVWMLIAALGLGLFARTQPAGLVAAAAGWLVTLVAGVAIIAAGSIAGIADLAGSALGAGDPDLQATIAAWCSFAIGLAAAAIGGWLVTLRQPARAD